LQPFCTPNTCRRLAGQSLQEAQRQAMHIGSAWATPSLHQATNRGVGPCPPQQPTNSTEPSSPNCWAASVLLSTNSNLSPWHTSPMPERGGQQGCNAYPSCHHDSHVTDVTSHPHHLNPMPSSGGWLSTLRFHPHLFSSFSGAALTWPHSPQQTKRFASSHGQTFPYCSSVAPWPIHPWPVAVTLALSLAHAEVARLMLINFIWWCWVLFSVMEYSYLITTEFLFHYIRI